MHKKVMTQYLSILLLTSVVSSQKTFSVENSHTLVDCFQRVMSLSEESSDSQLIAGCLEKMAMGNELDMEEVCETIDQAYDLLEKYHYKISSDEDLTSMVRDLTLCAQDIGSSQEIKRGKSSKNCYADHLLVKELKVKGSTKLKGNVYVQSSCPNQTVTIDCPTILNGPVSINDNLSIRGNLKALRGAFVDLYSVNTFNVGTEPKSSSAKKDMLESGSVTDVAVKAHRAIVQPFTVDGSGNVASQGTLFIAGATQMDGGATISGGSFTVDGSGNVSANGSALVGGNLNVTGAATIDGAATVNGVLTANGGIDVAGGIDLSGGLTLGGNLTGTTANFSGLVSANNGITISGGNFTVDSSGNVVAAGTLDVAGNTLLGGNLNVTGNATIAGTATIAGQAEAGSFYTPGNAVINGVITAQGGIVVNSNLTGTTAYFGNTATFANNVTIANGAAISGGATISGGNFTVDSSGNVVAVGNSLVGTNLNVTGTSTLNGAVTANNSMAIGGTLDVAGNTLLAGNLNVTGSADVQGMLTARGGITIYGGIEFEGGATFNDNLTGTTANFSGLVTANSIDAGATTLDSLIVTNNFTGNTANLSSTFSAAAGAFSVDSAGGITATSITSTSTRRLKNNIENFMPSSDTLLKVKPVTFDYKNDVEHKLHYGFIAEEIESLYPALVSHNAKGEAIAVNYVEFTPVLLHEIQKQHRTLLDYSTRIERLEEIIAKNKK